MFKPKQMIMHRLSGTRFEVEGFDDRGILHVLEIDEGVDRQKWLRRYFRLSECEDMFVVLN